MSPTTSRTVRRIPRSLARAPIRVFRLGLGGVFAGRLVLVDHRGRRSGLVRHVVLETVAREGRSVVVVSGYGWSAQWLRNVRTDPRVRLWSGWGTGRSARAEILEPAEALAVLEGYRRAHPRVARCGLTSGSGSRSCGSPRASGVRTRAVRCLDLRVWFGS